MTSKRPRIFYGWLIVFVSAVGLFLGAPLLVFSFSVFFKPLMVDFHASRASVSLAFSLFNLVGALSIPFTGMVIDRFRGKARHPCVHPALRRGVMFRALGRRQLVAALSLLHSLGSCHGERPRAGSLWGGDFSLVQSPSGTCTGIGDDGNWHWLGCGSYGRSTPHQHLRVAHCVRNFRGRRFAGAASGSRWVTAGRSRTTRPAARWGRPESPLPIAARAKAGFAMARHLA